MKPTTYCPLEQSEPYVQSSYRPSQRRQRNFTFLPEISIRKTHETLKPGIKFSVFHISRIKYNYKPVHKQRRFLFLILHTNPAARDITIPEDQMVRFRKNFPALCDTKAYFCDSVLKPKMLCNIHPANLIFDIHVTVS